MEKDLISVVIPAYGHAHYIEKTIRSVINQTYKNIELIILNDGSPDKTSEVIESMREECEQRFARFVFIDKENEGVVKTMNRGLKEAKGEYISSIASDDSYENIAFETLHDFLSCNSEYGFAVGDNYIMDDDGERCFWGENRQNIYNEDESKYKTFGDFLKQERSDVNFDSDQFGSYKSLLKGNYILNGFMIRRDILIDKIGGYNEDIKVEDYYLMLQIAKHTKLKYINQPLFNYRWHESNTIKQIGIFSGEGEKLIAAEKEYAIKHGYKNDLYRVKSIGVPFILEFQRRFTENGKEKLIKLFGITIFRKIKS